VREFSREDERRLRLIFDNPAPGSLSNEAYERAVTLAASLAWHFSQEDTELSFATQDYTGDPDVYQFLRHLATVKPSHGPSVLVKLAPRDDYNIVLTTQTRGSIPTGLWNSSYVIFLDEQGSAVSRRALRPEKLLRRR